MPETIAPIMPIDIALVTVLINIAFSTIRICPPIIKKVAVARIPLNLLLIDNTTLITITPYSIPLCRNSNCRLKHNCIIVDLSASSMSL